MSIVNSALKWGVIILLVLLVVPLVAMLGMMAVGTIPGSGMMSQMVGMMSGGSSMGMMSHGAMALCAAWLTLVAVALVFLIVLLVRNPKPPVDRQKAA